MSEETKVAPTAEQERHARVRDKIATLEAGDQRGVQAAIAMIELALKMADPRFAILAVAYVSTRIAAGIEAVEEEKPRIITLN